MQKLKPKSKVKKFALSKSPSRLQVIKEEVKRYQELRAAEITTQARTVRAQALPSMAIELEERAEAIERQYRMGLIAEDTHEETEAISSSVVELKKHVFGAREAVFSDNEQFVRDITVSWEGVGAKRSEAKAVNLRRLLVCGESPSANMHSSAPLDFFSTSLPFSTPLHRTISTIVEAKFCEPEQNT